MIFFFVSTFLLAFLVQASAFAYRHPEHLQAIARIRSADGKIKGQIEFVQQFKRGAPTHIFGNFSGLSKGAHGIGIMDYGNMLKGCESMGAEFNPDRMRHRARQGNAIHRVGALGNVRDGEYKDQFNQQVSLFGRNSVFGRGVVVFENSDDGSGRADAFQSERNGNVGRSIACGIIGRMGGNFV
ncbi:hypothetical protein L596_018437 [Steinernema carpocapsae]|uniref:Superoxide dismutase copper/zinc binding domain-containing protein n=1 Tax=Steinernema carpocapsae TaxID=34508 RepID=A0A4U5N4L8_STECR|nr:hypothetical protein L596_018437 [Steinernema carpocapsae]